MERCDNCNLKIGDSLFSKDNKILSPESLIILNNFLDEKLNKKSFCQVCLNPSEAYFSESLLEKHNEYLKEFKSSYNTLNKEVLELNNTFIVAKSNQYDLFKTQFKIYSNTPVKFTLLEYVESFIIVDSGMWSTSSDNLDAMWGAVHDSIATIGVESENKLSKGFADSKYLLKKAAFIIGGNCVVDIKHSFSELAGNGKILIHCQGTAAIDNNYDSPDFSETTRFFKNCQKELEVKLKPLSDLLKSKSMDKLKITLESLDFI